LLAGFGRLLCRLMMGLAGVVELVSGFRLLGLSVMGVAGLEVFLVWIQH